MEFLIFTWAQNNIYVNSKSNHCYSLMLCLGKIHIYYCFYYVLLYTQFVWLKCYIIYVINNSGGSRISRRGVGVDSRGGYILKILYVETKESGPLVGRAPATTPT